MVQRRQDDNTVIQNVNEYTISGYTTDLTKVVTDTEAKVVTITGFNYDWDGVIGSGVVYAVEENVSYIITNYHVIEEADEVRVLFNNGEEIIATIVGVDNYTDLALLSVETEFSVDPFNLGDSSLLKKGEYVLGIGTPIQEEFFGTVTFGIISGKNRSFLIDSNSDGKVDWELDFLQTDAAVNPGNSGGALINLAGDLVGLTTMRVASSDTEGMNFAIGINEIVPIVEQLKEKGEVHRAIFGIQGLDIASLTTYQKGHRGISLDQLQGILVTTVLPDTPAKEMGILEGDIILKINEIDIADIEGLNLFLYNHEEGTNAEVTLLRAGVETVVIGSLQ